VALAGEREVRDGGQRERGGDAGAESRHQAGGCQPADGEERRHEQRRGEEPRQRRADAGSGFGGGRCGVRRCGT
jgi:hypothetical protein